MRFLVILALSMLAASFIIENAAACAPGNWTRPWDTTTCGCATDSECEHGVRHDDEDAP